VQRCSDRGLDATPLLAGQNLAFLAIFYYFCKHFKFDGGMHLDQLTPAAPLISAEESARRKAAIDYARGSVRLEGFVLDAEVEQLNQRYISGEISGDEHSAAIRRKYAA
jgi:hypothetical protein